MKKIINVALAAILAFAVISSAGTCFALAASQSGAQYEEEASMSYDNPAPDQAVPGQDAEIDPETGRVVIHVSSVDEIPDGYDAADPEAPIYRLEMPLI